jgi:predicted nuclease with TOPRIM domain
MPFKRELGGHGVPPTPANENLYWEKTTEDELGSNWIVREKVKSWEPDEKYETLRKQYSNAMIAAESAQDEIRILKQENTALNNNFNTVVRENDKLRKEPQNLHKERMRLENESLELDNDKKRGDIQGHIDYPHAAWKSMHNKVEEIASVLANRVAAIWVAIVAFGINEVIQWLTR